eukprot:357678-Chlamydomonas_euryale.AAC.1
MSGAESLRNLRGNSPCAFRQAGGSATTDDAAAIAAAVAATVALAMRHRSNFCRHLPSAWRRLPSVPFPCRCRCRCRRRVKLSQHRSHSSRWTHQPAACHQRLEQQSADTRPRDRGVAVLCYAGCHLHGAGFGRAGWPVAWLRGWVGVLVMREGGRVLPSDAARVVIIPRFYSTLQSIIFYYHSGRHTLVNHFPIAAGLTLSSSARRTATQPPPMLPLRSPPPFPSPPQTQVCRITHWQLCVARKQGPAIPRTNTPFPALHSTPCAGHPMLHALHSTLMSHRVGCSLHSSMAACSLSFQSPPCAALHTLCAPH